jgi:hypothetical protein
MSPESGNRKIFSYSPHITTACGSLHTGRVIKITVNVLLAGSQEGGWCLARAVRRP